MNDGQHRYFPRMERNEAILLKCYDSIDDGRARFTAHTSFEDPSTRLTWRRARASRCVRWFFWTPETVSATTAAVAPAQEL